MTFLTRVKIEKTISKIVAPIRNAIGFILNFLYNAKKKLSATIFSKTYPYKKVLRLVNFAVDYNLALTIGDKPKDISERDFSMLVTFSDWTDGDFSNIYTWREAGMIHGWRYKNKKKQLIRIRLYQPEDYKRAIHEVCDKYIITDEELKKEFGDSYWYGSFKGQTIAKIDYFYEEREHD